MLVEFAVKLQRTFMFHVCTKFLLEILIIFAYIGCVRKNNQLGVACFFFPLSTSNEKNATFLPLL